MSLFVFLHIGLICFKASVAAPQGPWSQNGADSNDQPFESRRIASPVPSSPNILNVLTAGYAGNSVNNTAACVAVDEKGVVWLGGQGQYDYDLKPTTLIAGKEGFLVSIDVKSSASRPTAKNFVVLGNSVTQVFWKAFGHEEGRLLVSGDFGVAVLDGQAEKLLWHNDLSSFPGSNCSAPSHGSSVHTCRVAMASDGHVAVVAETSSGYELVLFDSNGKIVANDTLKSGGHYYNDVAIDPKNKLVIVTYFYNTHLPTHLPVQVPCIFAVDYTLKTRKWQNYCWSGSQMTGNEADSRGELLFMNEADGFLYFAGIAYGGNTCFRFSGTDLKQKIDMVAYDSYTNAYNTGSDGITFVSRIHPSNGEILLGQILLGRLPTGKGNSVEPKALSVDDKGYVALAQSAACCIDSRNNLTVSGMHLGNYSGGDAVALVLAPDFSRRVHWTVFTKQGKSSTGAGQAIATGGGRMAFVATSIDGQFVEENALPDTRAKTNAENSFLAVWSTEDDLNS